jgi:lipopolysaccharide heptosyltransferase I
MPAIANPNSLGPRANLRDDSQEIYAASRILIIRLSAVGDVIHGLPVLNALREAKPKAFIAWAVEGHAADLLEGHPALDQLVRLPRRWLKSPSAVLQLRQKLRSLQFDTTIDLQCLTKSGVVAWLSGAPQRIGKAGPDARELSRWFQNRFVECHGSHVIEHYLDLLQPLGISEPTVRFELPERDVDGQFSAALLEAKQWQSGGFAVLNPGAGWPSKLWPADRYGEIAHWLGSNRSLPSLAVWGTPDEKVLAEKIVSHSHGHAVLAPATSMLQLAALCRRARLFVGSDTGPMHLAVAVGTPTVSLHGPTRAEWCGAYGPGNIRLQVRCQTAASGHRHEADDSAMREITTDMVWQACLALLKDKAVLQCG